MTQLQPGRLAGVSRSSTFEGTLATRKIAFFICKCEFNAEKGLLNIFHFEVKANDMGFVNFEKICTFGRCISRSALVRLSIS